MLAEQLANAIISNKELLAETLDYYREVGHIKSLHEMKDDTLLIRFEDESVLQLGDKLLVIGPDQVINFFQHEIGVMDVSETI